MRTGGVTAALLLLATLVLQVSTVEDIYWEGEEGASNEFLEVKEDIGSLSPLKRLKRFDWFNPFSLGESSTTTTTPAPANYEAGTEDPDDYNVGYDESADGSGDAPNKIEPDPSEKTLRVTFHVMEPYLNDYSNRDSKPFQDFSHSLASSVNSLFESLSGTQKASLVRIQSRVADPFSCKVTLDIVTSVDNTDQISDLLRNHIRNTRSLGTYTLTDDEFTANVVNPGSPFETCQPDELQCVDRTCVPGSRLCDGNWDCSDGADEKDCGFAGTADSDQGQRRDDSINQVESVPHRPHCDNPIPCASSSVTICPEKRCDGKMDCPLGEDEDPQICRDKNDELGRSDQNLPTTTDLPFDATTRHAKDIQPDGEDEACPVGEFRCDETRCVSRDSVCDRRRDCNDGTDEADCKALTPESCGADDFICTINNQCIAGSKKCDGVSDCPDNEDEYNCDCTSEEFKCIGDGSCIEGWKRCDGTQNCRDGSDEIDCVDGQHICARTGMFRCGDGKCISILLRCDGFRDCRHDGSDEFDCPCSSDQWQCDQGNCIKRSKRCDGRVDCPTDRSDERNCVATGYFKCSTGKVIPDSLRCDRQYDCPPGDYSDEQNCPCGDDDFRCDNGHCIQAYKRCDRTHDCQDGSDELHCKYGTDCMAYEFKCASGQCVHAEAKCNGTVECADGSDEAKTCPCKRGQFRCHDGSCINIAYRCDTHRDCSKGEDELNCHKECHHECDGTCITDDRICDGNPDCSNGSDEGNCDNCDGPDDFRCDDKQCVSADSRCNGEEECDDGSDERNCNETISATRVTCPEGQFQCRDGNCLNNDFVCDGRKDCVDDSDEQNCPCKTDEYRCDNGQCIPKYLECDRNPDCDDRSDEAYCTYDSEDSNPPPWSPPVYTTTTRIDEAYGGPRPSYPNNEFEEPSNGDRNSIDSPDQITTQAPNGRNDPYSTERPGSRYPYATERPGSRYPSATERPGSRYPSATDRPGSRYPSATERPGSRYPYATERPGSRYPYATERPGSRYPSATERPGSRYPYATERPEQEKPGSDSQSGVGSYPGGSVSGQGSQPGSSGGQSGVTTYSPYSNGGRPGSSDPYNTGDRTNYYDQNGGDRYPGGSSPGQFGSGSSDNYDDNNNAIDSATGYPGSDNDKYPVFNPPVPNGPFTTPPYQQPGYEPNGDKYYGSGSARGGSVGCNSSQWRCENGPCIDARQRCDGHIDCPLDYSDEFDCPAGSPVTLNVKTYPDEQSVRFGGDVVFQCRDEGPLRAAVRWSREGDRKMKPGFIDNNGRLELYKVTVGDSGTYICQTLQYQNYPGSQVRVTLRVRRPDRPSTERPQFVPCKPHEATCGNGQCIPKSAVCDTRIDCADRSDEDSCTYGGKCEPNQFQCANRKCVLKSWVCDSDDDCGDGSDEKSCPKTDPTDNCMPMEYACRSGDQCIPKSFHCDKHSDCLDGSDEIGCSPVYISSPPKPANVRLNPGDTLQLSCTAVGVPEPLISWRLNWGHVPPKCTSTSRGGVGQLTCPNMMPEDSGAYSCEAINYKGTLFATPDSIVFVSQTDPCPQGYFNNEARSQNDCIRCFCFGKSTQCRSADLFTYNMPTPLGQGGTRLVGVALSDDGKVRTDSSITNHYYYNPLRNGATVTKLESRDPNWLGTFHPYLTLPESYNGNQLTSYGGHIKYTVSAHTQAIITEDDVPAIIVMGKYATLYHMASSESMGPEMDIVARFVPEYWKKPDSNGQLIPASREDIMMALDAIDMVMLRADNNNAGVNITQFEMESAHNINSGLGAASLVEECTCPEGYDGLSCQKCKPGFELVDSGPWLGHCVRKECPPGTYGDPRSGYACKPCPCPLTNRDNQFATTCSLGSDGSVTCDCFSGYEGKTCEKCAAGFVGNPLIAGDKCRVPPSNRCDPIGTRVTQPLGECVCKDNVHGQYCDQCNNGSFYLSNDFRDGCAQCFCSGESSQCMSSNLRRKTTEIRFNIPSVVAQTGVYASSPAERGNFKYTAPVESELRPELGRGGVTLSGWDTYRPVVYYWSMPMSFNGNKVTSYGGYLRYTLDNVPSYVDARLKNTAADVILISENHLTYQYYNTEYSSYEGVMNVTVPLLEKGWKRPDGIEVPRELFLLALADVKAILIKATYSSAAIASPLYASIETAESDGDGPAALHVEQCVCPAGHIGTSCEDCAPGYTRGSAGMYLGHCEKCQCNGHSESCHPETGECYECLDHTEGPHCEQCKPGFESDGYDNCIPANSPSTDTSRCDPRGTVEYRDEYGSCTCKRNVDGEFCDRCRPGTFGLDSANPDGCISCFCSGATNECQEAQHYSRVALPAPILGDNYGGYTIMDLGAETVINDNFNPVPGSSELMFNLHPADKDLYWSLPVFPGNRVLSYGGNLSLRQEFKSNDYYGTSEPGNDVILVGDGVSVAWANPNVLRSGEALSYQVPLREEGWTLLNQAVPADRTDFMRVLKSLRRVLVKATLAPNIISTIIGDVAMDTATDMPLQNMPVARGIEMCVCPPGHQGTSCETCDAGFYKNKQDFCESCPCNGHDCQLDTYGNVQCNCRPPYTGPDCSTIGLIMELHPTIRDNDSVLKHVTLTCKYRAPEKLTIKFVVEGKDVGTVKWANESILLADGWHGQHELHYTWDTSEPRRTYECHTITQRGSTLGVLYEGGQSLATDAPLAEPSVSAKIFPRTITIQEIGKTVNFTCVAQSRWSKRPQISWSKVDGELPQGRYIIDQNEGTLTISNLQITDSGQYICQTSDGRSTNQDYITLKVPGNAMTVPTVEIRPPMQEYFTGERVELRCLAEGSPKPRISWQRASSRPLPASSTSNDDLLIIEDVREEDSGEYRCTALNSLGSADGIAVIRVRPRPAQPSRDRLVVTPQAPVVEEGQSTTVVCTGSTAVPAGTIDWVRQDGARFQANVRSDNGVLYIEEAIPANEAVYICQSRGSEVDATRVMLTVNPKPTAVPDRSPYVTVPVKSFRIASGKSDTIDCQPHGPLRVKWSKYDSEFGRGVSQRGNTLIINEAEESDAGYYVCDGLDNRGQTVSTVYVNVDIDRREAPRVQIWPEDEQPVALGSNQFQFRCNALAGIPSPAIVWSRAGGRPLSHHVEIRPNNILWFNEIEVNDEGEYICTGTNEVGSASASAKLKVRSPPDVVITPTDFMEVNEGDPINIECHAEGHPQPRVTITGPGGNVISSEWLVASLRVGAASERDEGEYACTATNDADSIVHTFEVRVIPRGDGGFNNIDDSGSGYSEIDPGYDNGNYNPNPDNRPQYPENRPQYPETRPQYPETRPQYPENRPQNPERPSDSMIAFEGQPQVSIICNVTGGYNPTWDRADRKPLQRNAKQEGDRLVIYNVSASDSGLYRCSVYDMSTRQVRVSAYPTLRVVRRPTISLQPPTQKVYPGNSPTVECVVTGDDITDITWRPTTKPFSSRVRVTGATLIFQQIEVEDAGQYECVARSPYASASATAEVIVVEESDVAQRESHDHEQWVHAGAGVVLSCNATGTGVRVRWTKDGEPVPRSVTTRRDGSLYIRLAHASHSGHYVCHITDSRNRHTNNFINLHIEGNECLSTEFRCVETGSCIDEELVCDGFEHCSGGSDEEDCFMRDKRYSADGPEEALVRIEQPRRQFRVGENADVLCKSTSRNVAVEWVRRDQQGNRQYVDSNAYGGGSLLMIRGVEESDGGEYLCIGRNRFGQNYTDTFNLEIVPDSAPGNQRERNVPVREYTARLRESISLPCNHNLEEPVSIQWRREYVPLPADARTTQPILRVENVNEGSAGTYVCRASSGRGAAEFKALLRVIGVVPRFEGDGWLALSTLTDAYLKFYIQISFKPTDNHGLILYNSYDENRNNDFIALFLDQGVPEFVMDAGDGPVSVKGDRPLALNQWHTIRLNRIEHKVIMEVDEQRPVFESEMRQPWTSLELRQPLFIGGVPDYDKLPEQLAGVSGFVGCVSSLVTGAVERNMMLDQLDFYNVKECDTCAGNLCQNGAICQESRTARGYTCLCSEGWAGENCERRGEGCRPGLCGPGKCMPTQDGYKCACPVTHTGANCETRQVIGYPAFSGSSYLGLKPPGSARLFKLSLKVKATSPMTDGLIMYCAESARDFGGFTSIAVRNGYIEFHYDVSQDNSVVLRSKRPLPANEWTEVQVTRAGKLLSLDINHSRNDERTLDSTKSLKLETLIYIGGTDDSVILNPRIGVSSGFQGCIKDLKGPGGAIDIVNDPNVESSNLQECSNAASVTTTQRGDIPAMSEPSACSCQNGGTCLADGSCVCPPGFSGYECEARLSSASSSLRRPRPPPAPCAAHPCLNGGTCHTDYLSLMNHTCDCPLGFSGASCQIPWRMEHSVSLNGNGFVELPQQLVDYRRPEGTPAVVALRVSTLRDGVLLYQQEARAPPDYGDYLLIRIENGYVVLEWDNGGGASRLSLDTSGEKNGFVADGEMHQIVVKLLNDGSVELSVDGAAKNDFSKGIASTMNADSNIYIGGIPDSMNMNGYGGLSGCIDQVEFMDTGRGVDLGETAVAARNTQPCNTKMFADVYPYLDEVDAFESPPPEFFQNDNAISNVQFTLYSLPTFLLPITLFLIQSEAYY